MPTAIGPFLKPLFAGLGIETALAEQLLRLEWRLSAAEDGVETGVRGELEEAPALFERAGLVHCAERTRKFLRGAGLAEFYYSLGLEYSASLLSHQLVGDWPQVSAYVPCYNAAARLEACITSLRAQTYPISELFIVDDGSSDTTLGEAKRLGVETLVHGRNQGVAAARNTALARAGAPLLFSIDADETVDPFCLERLVLALRRQSLDGIAGRVVERHTATVANSWRAAIMKAHHGNEEVRNVALYGGCTLFKTAALRHVGGYDHTLRPGHEDIEVCERLLKSGHPLSYVPSAVCYHERNDPLLQVLDQCFKWRLTPYLRAGVYRTFTGLATKWITSIRSDLEELRVLQQSGGEDLSFVSYLNLFYSIIRDLEIASDCLEDSARKDFCKGAAGCVRYVICRQQVSPRFLERLKYYLTPLLGRYLTSSEQSLMSEPNPLMSNLLRIVSGGAPYLGFLVTVFEPLPDVLRVSRQSMEALERSAELIEAEEASPDYLQPKDVWLLELGGRGGAPSEIGKFLAQLGMRYSNWRVNPEEVPTFEQIERIVGGAPKAVILLTGPESDSSTIWLLRMAERLPGALFAFICDPRKNCDFVKGAASSRRIASSDFREIFTRLEMIGQVQLVSRGFGWCAG